MTVGDVQAAPLPSKRSARPAGRALPRRRLINRAMWGSCLVALAAVVAPVIWILVGVVSRAFAHFHFSMLTKTTAGAGNGGLANAIVGTLLLMLGVLILAGIVGVASGVYLAEYASGSVGSFLRGASEVLAGVPSIVLGYVGYLALVVGFKGLPIHWGFSLAAALVVLSVMVVPYVTKSTEVALRNVPTNYREGGDALGMRSSYALRKLVMRPALPGITTGLIVALAIAIGETAPLLYTAGFLSRYPSLSLTHSQVPYLTYIVWTFYNYPSNAAHQLSYLAAFLLILLVVVMIVIARVLVSLTQRNAPDRPQGLGKARK